MTIKLLISAAAKQDLKRLHKYGEEKWGAHLSKSYLTQIKEKFEILREHLIGVERSELFTELRSLVCNQHIVFYIFTEGVITVHRVLHARQDPNHELQYY